MTTATTWAHPAKWSRAVLPVVAELVAEHAPVDGAGVLRVLDPFAGVGRSRLWEAIDGIADRPAGDVKAVYVDGLDLQPEACVDDYTRVGDATDTGLPDGFYTAIATSPCYANRMADSHDAADRCRDCHGAGRDLTTAGLECRTCKGMGVTRRNTYAHTLRAAGGDLVAGSAAGMQWGRAYRELHSAFIAEAARVLAPGGVAVINMSNHIRAGREVRVVEWWLNELILWGWGLLEVRRVATPRQRMGANGGARVEAEHVIAVRRPT